MDIDRSPRRRATWCGSKARQTPAGKLRRTCLGWYERLRRHVDGKRFVPERSEGDWLIWLGDDGSVQPMDYVFELVTHANVRVLLGLPRDAPLSMCFHV